MRAHGTHRKGSKLKSVAAEPYRDIDFSSAKRGRVAPSEHGKTKVSIRIDNAVIEYFRAQVERAEAGNYQTLMNDARIHSAAFGDRCRAPGRAGRAVEPEGKAASQPLSGSRRLRVC